MTNRQFPDDDIVPVMFNPSALPEKTGTPRLLLVDDEPGMRDSLGELLRQRGFELNTASSGSEAIQLLTESPYALILLDIGLPDMSGHDVMDFINQHTIDTTVIVVSGDVQIESAIGALQRGAFNYLRKPFQPEKLLKTVENALNKRALESSNRQIAWRLEYSEKLHRNLIDHSPDIIYTLNSAGHFTFINDRVHHILGYMPAELIGQHYSTLVHADDLERAHFVFRERREGDRASRNAELRLCCKNADYGDRTFDMTLVTISFNATGVYVPDIKTGEREYVGSYGVARDITDRKRAEELISYQAHHDILTDLPNRALFKEQLSLALIQARRTQTSVAILLLNLDRFKLVNDSLGHVKGDELLQQVATRLKQCMNREDLLSRVGGDEFCLILPQLKNREEARNKARQIINALHPSFMLGHDEIHVSASIGIAIYPEDGRSGNDLIRHADIAMYQVKAQGKDGLGFYDDSMQDASHEKITLEKSLRKGLEKSELEMYYQPQVEVESGRIVGAEALMRWNHPHRGLVTANAFLPVAEECGLMLPLSDWMLGAVSRDQIACQQAGCRPIRIDINVSPQSLEHKDFFDKLQETLTRHNIQPELIGIEITENICIRNPQHAIEQINKLHQLGISVSIDDFGTGYSSLAYLHRFPIGTIKIDQAFVREIQSEDGHYPVVLAIISIARGLGLKLVAEGVENELQANYLKHAGCTTMQGYFFHRPMPRDQLIQLLQPDPGTDL